MTKAFSRWAKGILPERALCRAAREIEQGHFEVDLGGGLCKKRIARPGAGKSGGTRTLVAKQHRLALFFLVGRSKSDPGTDFVDDEVDVAKAVAAAWARRDDQPDREDGVERRTEGDLPRRPPVTRRAASCGTCSRPPTICAKLA